MQQIMCLQNGLISYFDYSTKITFVLFYIQFTVILLYFVILKTLMQFGWVKENFDNEKTNLL